MTHPRLTIRWLMLLVALVGVGIGGWGTFVRARHFQKKAAEHALAEREQEVGAVEFTKIADDDAKWYARWKSSDEDSGMFIDHLNEMPFSVEGGEGGYAENRAMIENFRDAYRKGAAEERQLRIKYEHAVRHPWLLVRPDPTPGNPHP